MNRRQPQVHGRLREADRLHAAGRNPSNLCGGQLDIPEWDQTAGDQATVGSGAPLIEHEVVVGTYAQEGEVFVLTVQEPLTAEANRGQIGEAELRLHSRDVHVRQPLRGLPATGPNLVEGGGPNPDLALREPRRRRLEHERETPVLVVPDVGPIPVLGLADVHVERHPLDVRDALANHVRTDLPVPLREAARPQVGGSTMWSSAETING